MSQIATIKAAVAPADAARQYGLAVENHGMACCPYHDDRHPSMKLYYDHFYCFACGAHGDVMEQCLSFIMSVRTKRRIRKNS